MRTALAALIDHELAAAGVRLAVSPATAALAVNALSNGLAIERLADPDAVPDELVGTLILRLLGGLLEAPEGGA